MKQARKSAKLRSEEAEDFYPALFALIEKEGWFGLTLPRVAQALGMHLPALMAHYGDKDALLLRFGAYLDKKLAETMSDVRATFKERMFELLMQRFDFLQPYRGGMIRLLMDAEQNPVGAVCLGGQAIIPLCASMARLVELAGISATTQQGRMAAFLLKFVYLDALRVWRRDESRDLSATMAALDRNLVRLVRIVGL